MRTPTLSLFLLILWCATVWWFLDYRPSRPVATTHKLLVWHDFFTRHLLPGLPVATTWNTPLRPPDGDGVLVARPFGADHHVGEDWNTGEGDADLGEPVYAPADGWVSLAFDFQSVWGKVIMLVVRLPEGASPPAMEIMLAHLATMEVEPFTLVRAGQRLGTMGTAEKIYPAHLHWEVRERIGLGLGGGYADDSTGWRAPGDFLIQQRPIGAPWLVKKLPSTLWEKWGSD